MTDTDKLRPEVAEAVERMCTPMGTKYMYTESRDAACMATIRAELLRLAGENAQLRDVLADRDMDREMAAHANRELAALKARIADAPITQVTRMAAIGGGGYEWAGCRVPDTWNGKRVAMVLVED